MISFTKTETIKIDEKDLFEDLKEYLFEQTVFSDPYSCECVADLPEDIQRLIFAKIGAMMIDYSRSENF